MHKEGEKARKDMSIWYWLVIVCGLLLVLVLLRAMQAKMLQKKDNLSIGPASGYFDIETQGQIDLATSSPGLLALLLKASRLEAQAQRNPQALIEVYEQIAQRLQPDKNPIHYPSIHNSLGLAYINLPTGNRTSNLQRAIACFQKALSVWTLATNPAGYASAQDNMGLAYCDLLVDRATNIEKAIACYKEALRFRKPETTPLEYARTCVNLGIAYYRLPIDKVSNSERGIGYFREALRFQTPKTAPVEYARTMTNLGAAYSDLPAGKLADQQANLTKAIACYKEALKFQSPSKTPSDYGHTQHNLSVARERLRLLGRMND